jgi:predicted metalloprotease
MRRIMLALSALAFAVGCRGDGGGIIEPGSRDQDSDGLFDEDDRCPSQPETANNWDDEDGCPDTSQELYQFARDDIEAYWQRTFPTIGRAYAELRVFQGYTEPIQTPCGTSIPDNAFFCSLRLASIITYRFWTGF